MEFPFNGLYVFSTHISAPERVDEIAENGDVVLILGAGTIEKLARMWG
jgi:UDP-N-acetylmuramate-alanine ligase